MYPCFHSANVTENYCGKLPILHSGRMVGLNKVHMVCLLLYFTMDSAEDGAIVPVVQASRPFNNMKM